MKSTAKVVIVGGGIQGISVAYHLARAGLNDVCLLEMNTLGSGSSGRSATVTAHSFTSEHCLPLVQRSFEAYMRFTDELEADPGYERIGFLLLCGAGAAPDLRNNYHLLQRKGVESQLLDPAGIAQLTPGLNLEDIELGLYTPHDGVIDAHFIMMAYAGAARRMGVRFVEGVKVTGLQVQGERVVGVHTSAGPVATGCVVNAAGFRAREVAHWAGMELPITNYKRHIFVTGPVAAYPDIFPFTYELEVGWYLRREGPGLLIGMGKQESDEDDPQVDWSFLDQVVEHSMHRAPPLAEAGVMSGWAGLRSLTPDDDPILGPAPHLEGFYNDCGWGGHGIMNAPAGGMILADLILHGQTDLVDVYPFRAERFPGWLRE
ncbi:MAG: FAD-binding oxidoreductase [Anaerolineae bacterium]|nr:FAD-binding oxidoreductase [Anaerolineae bacterium]